MMFFTNFNSLRECVRGAGFLFFCFPFLATFSFAQDNLKLIPAPVKLVKHPGVFIFSNLTVIQADRSADRSVKCIREFLRNKLKLNNSILAAGSKIAPGATALVLTGKGSGELPSEGYKLSISPGRITITGKDSGLFHGVQTLIQLLSNSTMATAKLPCLEIDDYPRFAYRGMLLDVARHFSTVSEVKQALDLMAAYKLNYFHWHLVDDQGWRIQIKAYPKLTSVGAIGNYTNPNAPATYYTQEEIKEVVKYAAERYITIVPEIEMPAHSTAALKAYPEFRCEVPAETTTGDLRFYSKLYCPTIQTFDFLENIIKEILPLFPGKYIHIGGDEATKLPWITSPFCQQLIKDKNLKDEHGLQSYFIQRMEKFINAKGKSIIGWDDILDGGLAPNATVMSWRGESGGIAAAQQKHYVIMSPLPNGLYFDYPQSTSKQERIRNVYAPLSKTYSYDPVPGILNSEEKKYILGVQGNIWTEVMPTQARREYMMLPRMFALAEVAWTPVHVKNYQDFSVNRLPAHLSRLDASGINYRVPVAIADTLMYGERFLLDLQKPFAGSRIYYTLDGQRPDDSKTEYHSPIELELKKGQKVELQTLVVTPYGRRSIISSTMVYNRPVSPSISYSGSKPGTKFRLFKDLFTSTEQFRFVTKADSGLADSLPVADFNKRHKVFGVIYEGFFSAENEGLYQFFLTSDSGAQLFIDGELVIDNDKQHTPFELKAPFPLAKGYHKYQIRYFNKSGNSILNLALMGPDLRKWRLNEITLAP